MSKNNSLLQKRLHIQFHPSLAVMLGVNEALVLQTMVFTLQMPKSGKEVDGFRWIWNTYKGWQRDWFPFWGIHTIERTFQSLEKKGLIVGAQLEGKMSRMKSYRVPEAAFTLLSEERFSDVELLIVKNRDSLNHPANLDAWYQSNLDASHQSNLDHSISEKTQNREDIGHTVFIPAGNERVRLPALESLEDAYPEENLSALQKAYFETETQLAKGKKITSPIKYVLALARKIEKDLPA